MNKLKIILSFLLFISANAIYAQPKDIFRKPTIKLTENLNYDEIIQVKNYDFEMFKKRYEDLTVPYFYCYDYFSFSKESFQGMLDNLKLTAIETSEGFDVVRIYFALNTNKELYLVFMGERYKRNIGNMTMCSSAFYKLKADNFTNINNKSDLEMIANATLKEKVMVDIKNYQTLDLNLNDKNIRSLSFKVSEYFESLRKIDLQITKYKEPNKDYFIKLRPAYGDNTPKDGILNEHVFLVINPEQITVNREGEINNKMLERFDKQNVGYWYDHMNPCPERCSENEIDFTKEGKLNNCQIKVKQKPSKK